MLGFVEGKVASRNCRPFNVPCRIADDEMRKELKEFLSGCSTLYLFPGSTKQQRKGRENRVRDALRRVDKEMEWKSMRRGTLQTLATSLTAQELLKFSHHASGATLMRYLGDGSVPEGHARSALAKSDVLGGATDDAVTVSDWRQVTGEGDVRFCGLPKMTALRDGDEYGLHLKECTRVPINMDACEQLAASLEDEGVVTQWRDMMRFLTDDTLYAHVPCDWNAPPATMLARDTTRLVRVLTVERTQR